MITAANWLGVNQDHLTPLDDTHALCPVAAAAFSRMQQAAAQDGVDMQIASSYRSFERQLSIWNRKWRGELPLYSLDGEKLNANTLNDEQRLHAILTWSALPGTSRHHWGTDVDVYDAASVAARGHQFQLVVEEYQQGGPCFALCQWLDKHLSQFDFMRPYASYTGGVAQEPWHISYKPIAQDVVKLLDTGILAATLEKSGIEGKSVILSHLEEIFFRYTLNGQPQ